MYVDLNGSVYLHSAHRTRSTFVIHPPQVFIWDSDPDCLFLDPVKIECSHRIRFSRPWAQCIEFSSVVLHRPSTKYWHETISFTIDYLGYLHTGSDFATCFSITIVLHIVFTHIFLFPPSPWLVPLGPELCESIKTFSSQPFLDLKENIHSTNNILHWKDID